ncbi:MAG TPA: hypothetical protein VE775_01975, partial [Pyrinomonadaceae bacterium]|nr:hypothetical protein [Pyrinomonadaceae bacterium]
MKSRRLMQCIALVVCASVVLPVSGAQRRRGRGQSGAAGADALTAKIRRFAPTVVTADTSRLTARDRRALDKIIAAAAYMDPLFLRQVWAGNPDLKARLERDTSPAGRARLHYFKLNAGPWSRLDSDEPFIEGMPPKPPQANFYPADMTKEEFNNWEQSLSADARERANGFFYVIRRDAG